MDATQCKMARAGLGWSARDLARESGVATATIARFELGRPISELNRDKLSKALADAGAQFSQKTGRIGVEVPGRDVAAERDVT
jgi:transcriptional regulator with XRE-family HTH domain